ncbi:MAG: amidase [Pseudomonadota bacterium]
MLDTNTKNLATVLEARDRLKSAQEKLHICAAFPGDVVEAEGRHCDALSAAGVDLGPLHGLPIVVKDIIDVAGMPTKAGSATRPDQPPAKADATVVAKLRAAGAVTVGKSHTVEFAFGGWGTNASQGTPRNPWKPDEPHTPGGSSNGTGVAVGGGFVPAGLGSDTGGSVRIPAAFCGCVGLKTSIGLVSRAGVVPLSDTFDTVGPLTDTVTRAAEMLAVMQGEDRADPTTLGVSRSDPLAGLEHGVSGLRLGRLSNDALEECRPEVKEAFETAVGLLTAAGATVETFDFPKSFAEYQANATAIIASDAYAFHADLADSNAAPLNDTTRMRMVVGRDLSAKERVRAQRARQADIAAFLAKMDRLDAIILPTAPITAIPLTEADENNYEMSLYTRVSNYLELSALSLPIGLTAKGLPTSLQIVVRRFDDPLALRIGRAFERARGPMPTPPAI